MTELHVSFEGEAEERRRGFARAGLLQRKSTADPRRGTTVHGEKRDPETPLATTRGARRGFSRARRLRIPNARLKKAPPRGRGHEAGPEGDWAGDEWAGGKLGDVRMSRTRRSRPEPGRVWSSIWEAFERGGEVGSVSLDGMHGAGRGGGAERPASGGVGPKKPAQDQIGHCKAGRSPVRRRPVLAVRGWGLRVANTSR